MTVTIAPPGELVGVAWLATLPGITTGMVGTTLPTDATAWETTGFLTVTLAGGVPDMYVPIRRPLLQVDVWAVKVGAQRPPWGRCDQLAQKVIAGCYGQTAAPTRLTVHAGTNTATARLCGAWPASEPTRVWGDDSSYARIRVDVRIDWI